MLVVQLFFGALGRRARAPATSRDDWPLMQGRLFPEGIDWSHGAAARAAHDPFLVHFLHRWWAWAVVAVLVVLARRLRARGRPPGLDRDPCAFGTQILLGIATVMTGVALWLAVLHQLVGALLVAATAGARTRWGGAR